MLIDRKTIDICLFTFVIWQIKNRFNFGSNEGNANENNDIPFLPFKLVKITKIDNNLCWHNCGKMGTRITLEIVN